MAFQKKENLNPTTLSKNTQYRLIEVEISLALKCLNTITGMEALSAQLLIDSLIRVPYDRKSLLRDIFLSPEFKKPSTYDLVQYLRYKNLGVHRIRKIAKVTPNALIQGGAFDHTPDLKPIFPYWDEISFILGEVGTWQKTKAKLNLFNEDTLIHLIEPKQTQTQPKQPTPTPEPQPEPVIHYEPEPPKQDRYIQLFNIERHNIKEDTFILEWTKEELTDPMQQQIMNDNIAGGQPVAIVTHIE